MFSHTKKLKLQVKPRIIKLWTIKKRHITIMNLYVCMKSSKFQYSSDLLINFIELFFQVEVLPSSLSFTYCCISHITYDSLFCFTCRASVAHHICRLTISDCGKDLVLTSVMH